jgi:hypothetical protein
MLGKVKVIWLSTNNSSLPGEVKGETIYVYDGDLNKALETLRHEFLDYAISQVIEPYKKIANQLIMLLNEEAYKRKEELIGKLVKIILSLF